MTALELTPEQLRLHAGPSVVNAGLHCHTGKLAYETIAHLDPPGFTTEPFTWTIFGYADDPIVIVDTIIDNGQLDVGCGPPLVRGGTLIGVLTPDNAMAVTLTADLDLYTALVGLGVEQDVDYDGDGVNESWQWVSDFRADPVWICPSAGNAPL